MLKGTTKIELTDVDTGEVEVVEKENMLTDAIRDLFSPMGLVKAGNPMFSTSYVEYYTMVTGGLLLLDTALEENPSDYFLPEGVKQTGCAVYNQQNTSGLTLRGNYNATESEFSRADKRVKYVYDFDTSEGNGKIACVALTCWNGGFGNQGSETAPERSDCSFFKNIGSGYLEYTGSSCSTGGNDRTLTSSYYGTGYNWIFKIDADIDSVFYFTIKSTTSIAIKRYRANIRTLSFFDRPGSVRRLLETTELTLDTAINTQYFSYNYDDETDRLYIVSASGSAITANSTYVITEIDMANDLAVKQYSMTNKTGVALNLYYHCNTICYRGFVYFTCTYAVSNLYYFYRQEIGNSANAAKAKGVGISRASTPMLAREGKIFYDSAYGSATSTGFFIIEVEDFVIKFPETYALYDNVLRQFVPVKGYPMTYFMTKGTSSGTFGIRTDYLATINNLSSPVVKTADKTMKVTYVLEEVDD